MSNPRALFRAALAAALAVGVGAGAASAATPPSGTLSESAATVSWTGGPKTPTASSCSGPSDPGCDHFALTVVPPSYAFKVEIVLTPALVDDWDLHVFGSDGAQLGNSGNVAGQVERVVVVGSVGGTYTVSAAPYAALTGYSASARLVRDDAVPPPPSSATPPAYANYVPPAGLGTSAGEPTLGVNHNTGAVMMIAGLETLRVRFDDCSSPATATWTDVSFLTTSQTTLDPILFTDNVTGRTFVSQLAGKTSLMAFTDDDGETWTPSQGSGINSGVDHQGVGGGPFAPGLPGPLTSYPNTVYYCSQDIALAECAVSRDGGLTFGLAVPIYNLTQCGGLHGHPKVGPDGTVYVPNKGCNGEQGVARSTDNGLTWTVRTIPGSLDGNSDPSVAIGADNTLYVGYGDGDGHPRVAVSRDHGDTWTFIRDVGLPFGIQNTSFPALVAGDGDRAAFAFLGSSQGGDGNADDPNWPGVWYLYVAHTYDGGNTWVTANATPNDPVQRGTICTGGVSCGTTRNLLDFMDVDVDAEGRVLVGYADGCIGSCVTGGPNSFSDLATIARQATGQRLFAAFDPQPGVPAAPSASATLTGGVVTLAWSTPVDNGSAITGYNVYRRVDGGKLVRLASVSATTHSFQDTTTQPGHTYAYQVRAVNALGEGPGCREVTPVVVTPPPPVDTCNAPGTHVADDVSGDSLVAALDVLSLAVAEPYSATGGHDLVLTLRVRDLTTFTPGHAWLVLWNRPTPDAGADRSYVAMRATGPGSVAFTYGRISPPSVNQGTDLGSIPGSYSADGTITLSIPAALAEATVGADLSGVEVRTFALNVSGQPVSQATVADFSAATSYRVVGNAACRLPHAPLAQDDTATTRANKTVQVDVLANDSDPDGDALAVVSVTLPLNGTVAAKRSGRIGYTPARGFTGSDTFTYTIDDGHGHTDTATVAVTVTP